jgi:hypothetical protein
MDTPVKPSSQQPEVRSKDVAIDKIFAEVAKIDQSVTEETIEAYLAAKDPAGKIDALEHHPAFQELGRTAMNQIHGGEFKAMVWFTHTLLSALEETTNLKNSSAEFTGVERLKRGLQAVRDAAKPVRKTKSPAEKAASAAAKNARRLARSQAGPKPVGAKKHREAVTA